MEVAKPKERSGKLIVLAVNNISLYLEWLDYVFEIRRKKRKEEKFIKVCRYFFDVDDLEPLVEGIFKEKKELEEILEKSGNEALVSVKEDLVEEILNYISIWNDLLTKEKIKKIIKKRIVPPRVGEGVGVWDNSVGTITSIENMSFEDLYNIIKNVYLEKVAELIEVIISTAITLKYVDRSRGIFKNRPNWLVLLSDPSTYKSASLDLLKHSKNVFIANKFTAAAFLSANPDVTPLIDYIHGRLFVIPTFTEEASDVNNAKKIFAVLESIYDGFYGKATGMSGFMAREVDTVVLSAITPAVWVQVFPHIQNIGSRWLVYRYELNDEEGITIQKNLNSNKDIANKLPMIVSKFFDFLIDNVTLEDLESIKPTENQDKDLQLMSILMAKLRAVFRIFRLGDDESKSIIDVEVVQREAPGRAYQQLLNFVRANTLLRKSELKRIVGIPVILDRSMKLAFKITLSSSDIKLANVFMYIAKNDSIPLSVRDIAKNTGLSKTTVERLLQVLQHPKVDLIYEENGYYKVNEPYKSLISKYLSDQDVF